MIRCIVNADDYGSCKIVNDAVVDLIEAGRVTSATILANGEAFDDAIARARNLPQCSFGVHLNVTQFAPLSTSRALRPILNDDAEFSGNIRHCHWSPTLQKAVFDEWQLQHDRVKQSLGRVSHIDSHHHIHTIPALFVVLMHFVLVNRIRSVRLTTNLYPKGAPTKFTDMLKKRLWNTALRRLCNRTTDYFCSLETFLDHWHELDEAIVEIMTHPGHVAYQPENKVIKGEWLTERNSKVQLVNYNLLGDRRLAGA